MNAALDCTRCFLDGRLLHAVYA